MISRTPHPCWAEIKTASKQSLATHSTVIRGRILWATLTFLAQTPVMMMMMLVIITAMSRVLSSWATEMVTNLRWEIKTKTISGNSGERMMKMALAQSFYQTYNLSSSRQFNQISRPNNSTEILSSPLVLVVLLVLLAIISEPNTMASHHFNRVKNSRLGLIHLSLAVASQLSLIWPTTKTSIPSRRI